MTLATVLHALNSGETAQDLAMKLGRTNCREVLPLLNRARDEGLLERTVTAKHDGERPLARWSFA
jgi:hypothetical protein